jgi:hypothetical protein
MIFKSKPTLTKEYLLSRNTQETYLRYYLNIPVKKGLFRSPFREDKHPTCGFYKNKSGDIIFKDFSGQFYGNFIEVVKRKYNVGYYEALQIIANDFGYISFPNLIKHEEPPKNKPKPFIGNGVTKLQIKRKNYSKKELDWWLQYGITKDILDKFYVFSCENVFLNGKLLTSSSSSRPIYGYYFGKNKENLEQWKCYFPFSKNYRFLCNSSAIQGSLQLPKQGDLLVVTKSMKDVMCLYSMGIIAIAPSSENLFLAPKQLQKLKDKFKHIVIFYDNDLPGISNMNKFKREFKLPCVWIPRKFKAKDISDFYKLYGKEKTLKLIEYAKETLRSVCKE